MATTIGLSRPRSLRSRAAGAIAAVGTLMMASGAVVFSAGPALAETTLCHATNADGNAYNVVTPGGSGHRPHNETWKNDGYWHGVFHAAGDAKTEYELGEADPTGQFDVPDQAAAFNAWCETFSSDTTDGTGGDGTGGDGTGGDGTGGDGTGGDDTAGGDDTTDDGTGDDDTTEDGTGDDDTTGGGGTGGDDTTDEGTGDDDTNGGDDTAGGGGGDSPGHGDGDPTDPTGPGGEPGTSTHVVPLEPNWIEASCSTSAKVEYRTVDGVAYRTAGSVAPGNRVVVESEALAGHSFTAGTVTWWAHTFDTPRRCGDDGDGGGHEPDGGSDPDGDEGEPSIGGKPSPTVKGVQQFRPPTGKGDNVAPGTGGPHAVPTAVAAGLTDLSGGHGSPSTFSSPQLAQALVAGGLLLLVVGGGLGLGRRANGAHEF